jgi:hypothetical protein
VHEVAESGIVKRLYASRSTDCWRSSA